VDGKTAEKLSKRIKYQAFKWGFGFESDDIAQDVLLRMLEGRHRGATVSQCVADYLRRNYADKRLPGNAVRKNLKLAYYDRSKSLSYISDTSPRIKMKI
jgi:hypothetical protein